MITCPRRQCSQQQGSVHRPVQPRPTARVADGRVHPDPSSGRAPGVEDDHDPPVALGPPRSDHNVGSPGGRAPVDRTDVVTDHVLPQRIEFGALAPCQCRRYTVDFAEPGQPRRQVLAGQERRQHPHLAGHRARPLPARQPERADRARGDGRGPLIAAADRAATRCRPVAPARQRCRRRAPAARPVRWVARHRGRVRETGVDRRCGSADRDRPAHRDERSRWATGRTAAARGWPPARRRRAPRSPTTPATLRKTLPAWVITQPAGHTTARAHRCARSAPLAWHRNRRQDAVEHGIGGGALQFGFRPQHHPVPQRRTGHRFDVVGGDVVAAGQP